MGWRQTRAVSSASWIAVTLGLAATLLGQDAPDGKPPDAPDGIRQNQPGFLVRVDVDRSNRSYREGNSLTVRVVSEEDAYLYVVYQQADGKAFQIFPNSAQTDNHVRARQTVEIPGGDDTFRWIVGPPFGKEHVKVIAAKEPLKAASDPSLLAKRFNVISPKQLKGIELELGDEEPRAWAEDQVEITTYAKDAQLAQSGARRFGVFFGVSDYEFNAELEAATEGKQHLNLPGCNHDARQMAALLHEVGDVSEAKIFTNDQATKANLQDAITGWLPRVSRPGDTVVIFFSGHGSQLADDNGDEADKMDESLIPYDYMSPTVFMSLVEKAKDGKLPAHLVPRVSSALGLVQQSGSTDEGIQALMRANGVSDDLFGHWLQRLAGRQVIVILDICHAGGFATNPNEKDIARPARFDYLDGELTRLKDIGQKDSALLAACAAPQTASARREADLSVLTYFLIESLKKAPGSVTLEQACQECEVGMKKYFAEWNRAREQDGKEPIAGHQPVMANFSTRVVYLKP